MLNSALNLTLLEIATALIFGLGCTLIAVGIYLGIKGEENE